PLSDSSYQRKFVIAKENDLANSSLYRVCHPKNGSPCLYRIGEKHCDEASFFVGETFRSWFYGNSVVSDGAIRLMSPVHPLFLAIPYFIKSKGAFVELEEVLCDTECPSIAVLLKNEQFLRNVDRVCELKEVLGTKVYRFSEAKALEWISNRFYRLRDALRLQKDLHKSIINDDDVLSRYAFGVLCDYMNPELATVAKIHLSIKDPPAGDTPHVDMSMKRKSDDVYEVAEQKPIKKSKESVTMKKLHKASKGTKSISNFFTRK
ncbi:hypothetical protein Angca_003070, partial [Angiostrongylus cantonensis]